MKKQGLSRDFSCEFSKLLFGTHLTRVCLKFIGDAHADLNFGL